MSGGKRFMLWFIGIFYVLAGIAHFVRTDAYMPMMPPYLPAHRELILLSGVAEVVLGLAVLVPQTRRLAAWGIILLLIAIFPANLHIAMHDVPLFGATQGAGIWNWVRLPFQGVLIAWAWWYTQADPRLRLGSERTEHESYGGTCDRHAAASTAGAANETAPIRQGLGPPSL
jgi:uncharacterized membrane protein